MPTKDRRAREKKRAAEEARLGAIFADKPAWLDVDDPGNLADFHSELPPKLKLKNGLLAFDADGNLLVNVGVMGSRADHANELRADASTPRAQMLAKKYPHLWVKRGGAAIIARLEGIPVRTVQNYIKKSRKASKVPPR